MIQDFFIPVSEDILGLDLETKDVFGNYILKNSKEFGFPSLEGVNIAVFDVREGRAAVKNEETGIGGDQIRRELYELYWGNWKVSIADLGTILSGNTVSDTYFAIQNVIADLVKKNILPIVIGGGMDLVYATYRGYDQLDQMANMSVISSKFSFGNLEETLSSNSYLSKIILEEPCNLFNYSNLGYQTYYNSQEEIALIDSLSFEAFRLGALKDISVAEPVIRDADIVAIDIGAVKANEAPGNANANPNGLQGEQICALARYSGISDKVTSFGIYEFNKLYDLNNITSKLISQIIWYFVEGYSLRTNDYPYGSKEGYLKYLIPYEEKTITFYQSDKSLRWWMQVDIVTEQKHSRHVLIPCSYDDYLNAIEQKMPDRWFKVHDKLT